MVKKVFIVVVIIVFVLAGLLVWYAAGDHPWNKAVPQSTGDMNQPQTADISQSAVSFIHTGNLMHNNPGLETNVWYLAYEAPGKPGQTAKLAFTRTSVCFTKTSSNEVCVPATLKQGERVSVRGIDHTDAVEVIALERSL